MERTSFSSKANHQEPPPPMMRVALSAEQKQKRGTTNHNKEAVRSSFLILQTLSI